MQKWEHFTDEELLSILQNSNCYRDALKQLGYGLCSSNNRVVKQIEEKLNYKIERSLIAVSEEEIIGDRYGDLQIIGLNKSLSKEKQRAWVDVKCNCGKAFSISLNALKKGNTKSCGCRHTKRENCIGATFGEWTVISYAPTQNGKVFWHCRCKCGQERDICAEYLKTGVSTSCGCSKFSSGESAIRDILERNNITYATQYTFPDLAGKGAKLRFDFAVFNQNKLCYLIEYQGEQHFEPINFFGGEEKFLQQQEYDNKKRSYCAERNIPLFEITYKENITEDKIIRKELLCQNW